MMEFNSDFIRNILTLRYDPRAKPVREPLIASDFFPKEIPDIEGRIFSIIKENLLSEHRKLNFQKISISLSGGIDSGLTLVMIRNILPEVKINCIGVGFGNEQDEVERAKEISRIYDCGFKEIIKEDILNDLPKLIEIVREPRWNLYNFYSLEEGKKYSDIFFAGDGGDELFGGYTFRLQKFLSCLSTNLDWKGKAELYLKCHERDWVPDQEEMFSSKIEFSWDKIYEIFKSFFDNGLTPIDQVFLADFNGKLLYDWLPVNIAYEKFFDLKIKSIFLSNEMIEFATHVPWQKKFDTKTGLGKLPLRSILNKHKAFEKEKMLKKGFGTDLIDLWNKNAKEIVRKYVNSDSEIIKEKIIDFEWLDKVHRNMQNSKNLDPRYINKMISLLALEIWYRLFISKSMKGNEKI